MKKTMIKILHIGAVVLCSSAYSDDGLDSEWVIKTDYETGYTRLLNGVSDLCLGVYGRDYHNAGEKVGVYSCEPQFMNYGSDNDWVFETVEDGYVQIKNRVSDLCLGVRGRDSHSAKAGVEVYYCDSVSYDPRKDSHWEFQYNEDDKFIIKNRVSDLCLGVRGRDSHSSGEEVDVYHCLAEKHETWEQVDFNGNLKLNSLMYTAGPIAELDYSGSFWVEPGGRGFHVMKTNLNTGNHGEHLQLMYTAQANCRSTETYMETNNYYLPFGPIYEPDPAGNGQFISGYDANAGAKSHGSRPHTYLGLNNLRVCPSTQADWDSDVIAMALYTTNNPLFSSVINRKNKRWRVIGSFNAGTIGKHVYYLQAKREDNE